MLPSRCTEGACSNDNPPPISFCEKAYCLSRKPLRMLERAKDRSTFFLWKKWRRDLSSCCGGGQETAPNCFSKEESGGEFLPLRVLPNLSFERMVECPVLPLFLLKKPRRVLLVVLWKDLKKVLSHSPSSRRILLTLCIECAAASSPHLLSRKWSRHDQNGPRSSPPEKHVKTSAHAKNTATMGGGGA